MLGYEAGYTAKAVRYNAFNYHKRDGTGTMVFLDDVECNGHETSLLQCNHVYMLGSTYTYMHKYDASVMCLRNGKACVLDINISTWFVLTGNLGKLYLKVGIISTTAQYINDICNIMFIHFPTTIREQAGT